MRKLSLLMLMMGLGLISTLNAQSIKGNTQDSKSAKNKIIKIKPFAPLLNNISVGYEHRIKNNISAEAYVGIIGAGFSPFNPTEKSGFFLSAGPKLYFGQDWSIEGMENLPLRGFYFKPEMIFSTYKSSASVADIDLTRNYRANSGALIFSLGRQFIAADVVTFEINGGLGYGFSNYNYTDQEEVWEEISLDNPRFFSHIQGGKSFPIAAKLDVSLGILF